MYRLSLVVVTVLWCGSVLAEDSVEFHDPRLKMAVEDTLYIMDPTPTDMLSLTDLVCTCSVNDGVKDISGLEYAANLKTVQLSYNQISDISPLAGLNDLQELILNDNQIRDLAPLADLTNLIHLDLHRNQVSDLSPLTGLTHLRFLVLYQNQVENLSALAGLTELESLSLQNNRISDIYPLSDLLSLKSMSLQVNEIRSIEALSRLTGLQEINLHNNLIHDLSPLLALRDLSVLDLSWNYHLNTQAYCSHLQTILDNNPGIDLQYTPQSQCCPPTGISVTADPEHHGVCITWDDLCNGPQYTSYFRVSRSTSITGIKSPISPWQTSLYFMDTSAESGIAYLYWVQSASSNQGLDAGDYSTAGSSYQCTLTISSAPGGSVITPGEGRWTYRLGEMIDIRAKPLDSKLFVFAGWTGTAVDAGLVDAPNKAYTTVVVDKDYTLEAHFVTTLTTLFVDDVNDPNENGTPGHPFDRIQEAIEVAADGATILVRPGTYHETIDLLGKRLHVTGIDPNEPNACPYPVIDGGDTGPILSFSHGEDPNCVVRGFVITRGKSQPAGAILCTGSSPTLVNCLVVGNRSADPNGAAISCTDSQATFVNCTIVDNAGGQQGAGLSLAHSQVILTNCIVWDNSPNQISLDGFSSPWITYTDVAGGCSGVGNLDTDPLFAQSGYWANAADPNRGISPTDPCEVWIDGDYHLQSQVGHWDGKTATWVQDDITSPCIDAGDPTCPAGQEPCPCGGIVNLGAYGGTPLASKSCSDPSAQ